MSAQEIIESVLCNGASISQVDGNIRITDPDKRIVPEMLARIRDNKNEIIAFLKLLEPMDHSYPAIDPQASWEIQRYRASTSQKRMLFMEELAGNESYYNMPVVYEISGELNAVALQSACRLLVAIHDVLRSTCDEEHGEMYIQVQNSTDFTLQQVDLRNHRSVAEQSQTLLDQEINHRFNLRREWPFRVLLIREAVDEYKLCINIHHIAGDGWSAKRIIADLSCLYSACCGEENTPTDWPKPYPYSAFVAWQDRWLGSSACDQAKAYWLNLLNGAPDLHSLPTDFIRNSSVDVRGDHFHQPISLADLNQLNSEARRYGVTATILLQSLFSLFLSRYSGEQDIVFGTAVANRKPIEFSDTVGLFVNTLALRFRLNDQANLRSTIAQAIELNRHAQQHQSYPFDSLIEELNPVRGANFNPLVQIMLVMQEDAHKNLTLTQTHCKAMDNYQPVSKFDLTLHCCLDSARAGIRWEYRTSLFSSATIARMAASFATLIRSCFATPTESYLSLPMVTQASTELQQVHTNFEPPHPVHKLFEAWVHKTPDATALCIKDQILSYRELNCRATILAAQIAKRIKPGKRRVGIMMDRSEHLVIALLACFKAAAVYVPLDPTYPERRLAYMIEDAELDLILTRDIPFAKELIPELPTPLFDVNALINSAAEPSVVDNSSAETPAYIIYTSGSTGKPKGVLVNHSSLYYSLVENSKVMKFSPGDRMPTVGSQAFGVSLLEILLPLINGASVEIVERTQFSGIEDWIQATNQVTVLHAVPSLMRQWLDLVDGKQTKLYPHLRLLLVGGEPVPNELLARLSQWRDDVEVRELYGMTESAVVCASYTYSPETRVPYCIGLPHPHANFYVLNSRGVEQPVGVAGELYIGGLSLAQGYINNPLATAKAFVENHHGTRLYKTGDRVRRLACGRYEFLGRTDNQVNLRGVRLELGEIEAVASQVAGVEQAICHVLTVNDEPSVALYFVSREPEGAILQKVKVALTKHLPAYMQPAYVMAMESLPLNANGKIDRSQLQVPNRRSGAARPPVSDLEKSIAEIWKRCLGLDHIGVDQSFFELGGHSLLASRVATAIRQMFSVDFPLHAVFETPTIEACAALVQQAQNNKLRCALTQKHVSQDGLREHVSL